MAKGGKQMNIGEKIIEIRKERKMTQEDFAKIFHVTRQTVSNWEHEKSYPDLQTIIQISDEFNISLDKLLKEDILMVKKIDSYKKYKKVFWGVGISILSIVICVIIYLAVCTVQHNKMYDKVLDAGFEKELTEDFIEKYQGYYALTEDGVDYLVEPKAIGKYEFDQEGKQVNVTENMTDEQRKRENELLSERKEELMPILHKALELWEAINN